MSDELDAARKSAIQWDSLARAIGYNELAKGATSLGEKAYFRLGRDVAVKMANDQGAKIEKTNDDPPILTLGERSPFIVFDGRDIELMRAVIKEIDDVLCVCGTRRGYHAGGKGECLIRECNTYGCDCSEFRAKETTP
jgi:hypothetical protein